MSRTWSLPGVCRVFQAGQEPRDAVPDRIERRGLSQELEHRHRARLIDADAVALQIRDGGVSVPGMTRWTNRGPNARVTYSRIREPGS